MKRQPHIHAEFIKLWADGHEIQHRTQGSKEEWTDMDTDYKFGFLIKGSLQEYRLKPESEYIPFKAEDRFLLNRIVISKSSKSAYLVLGLEKYGDNVIVKLVDGNLTAQQLLDDFVFLDDTPCGIKQL